MKKHPHSVISLLDTDLYKFTMMQAIMSKGNAIVEYQFRCRTNDVDLVSKIDRINEEIDHLCSLRLQPDESEYLRSLRFIKPQFVDALEDFTFKRKYITVKPSTEKEGSIDITIKGPWFQTILFEVPVLAIINQVNYEHMKEEDYISIGEERLFDKINMIRESDKSAGLEFSDFGTRRRFSQTWHDKVVSTLKNTIPEYFKGTSNVYLAKKYNLTPIGTMAHEYLQAFQVLGDCHLSQFQKKAFEFWAQEYRGDLGIALTDVVNLETFLKDFDLYFCKLFDGVRHDSGDPFVWGDAIIEHYNKNRVDPKTKTLTFSDGLDVEKMLELHSYFSGRAKPNFGVGTNLTNDVGVKALQVVLKMVRCNGSSVVKISDSKGKIMSDDINYINYFKYVFAIKD